MNKPKLLETVLKHLLAEKGKDKTQEILNSFSCKYNKDIDNFLKRKSIDFSNMRLATTYLVFTRYRGELKLIAYYAVANKSIAVKSTNIKSNSLKKKISRYSTFDEDTRTYNLSCHLIGQFAIDHSSRDLELINGDELMEICCRKIKMIQEMSSGKFVYLECEDVHSLKKFYEKHGFVNFGRRDLDVEEVGEFKNNYLVQYIKYLS